MQFDLENHSHKILDAMPFGKHKGEAISKLNNDPAYVTWLLGNKMLQIGITLAKQPWLKNFIDHES